MYHRHFNAAFRHFRERLQVVSLSGPLSDRKLGYTCSLLSTMLSWKRLLFNWQTRVAQLEINQ